MSSIPNAIAGSVSQAAIQQSQTARAADSVRNRDEQQAQRLRKLLEKHIEAVDESEKVDSNLLLIKEHHAEDQKGRKRRESRDEVELTSDDTTDAPQQPSQPKLADALYRHLDVEA